MVVVVLNRKTGICRFNCHECGMLHSYDAYSDEWCPIKCKNCRARLSYNAEAVLISRGSRTFHHIYNGKNYL